MKVLMVQPGEIPHETDIKPGLESLQAAVDGSRQNRRNGSGIQFVIL